jgi:hypothetical protein
MILKIKFENHDKYVLTCLVIRQFLMIIWMREVRTHPNFTRFVGQNTLKPVWICSTFSPSPRKYLLVVPRKYLLLVQCLTRMRYIYIIADLVAWITNDNWTNRLCAQFDLCIYCFSDNSPRYFLPALRHTY